MAHTKAARGNGQARGPLLAARASVAHRSAHVCVRRRMWHRSRQVAVERHSQLERWKDCTTVVDWRSGKLNVKLTVVGLVSRFSGIPLVFLQETGIPLLRS